MFGVLLEACTVLFETVHILQELCVPAIREGATRKESHLKKTSVIWEGTSNSCLTLFLLDVVGPVLAVVQIPQACGSFSWTTGCTIDFFPTALKPSGAPPGKTLSPLDKAADKGPMDRMPGTYAILRPYI